ncbi:MAG: DUF3857 domain-containing protein, partial [Bacteroidota bacterium]
MKSALFTALFILFSLGCAIGQGKYMKFGDVPWADLNMTTYQEDPEAEAVVLGDVGFQTFDFIGGKLQVVFSRHRRIKIINKAGFDFADVNILHGTDEDMIKLKATIHRKGAKKENLSKSDFLTEKISDNTERTFFTFPGVEEGCIIEFYYEISTNDTGNMKTWYFEDIIPVRHSEYTFGRPSFCAYQLEPRGNLYLAKHESSTRTESMVSSFSNGFSGGLESSNSSNGSTTKIRVIEDKFVMENRPAFREEPFMTIVEDYVTALDAQLKTIRWPNGQFDNFIKSWSQLSEELMLSPIFGKHLNVKSLKFDAVPLKGSTTKEQIIAAHAFISQKIKWNGSYRLFPGTENLKKVLESQTGSSAQINFLLINLLNAHGIKAYPVLGSKRDHGKLQSSWPFIDQFNHTMVLAVDGDQTILMDATDPNRAYNLIDEEALNRKGWVIQGAGQEDWINLTPPTSRKACQISLSLDAEAETTTGTMKINHTNYYAYNCREELNSSSNEGFVTNQLVANENLTLSNIQSKEATFINKPIKFQLDFDAEEVVTYAGDLIYISPIFVDAYEENPFKKETRNFPIDFPYPFSETYVVAIDIPEGYEVEELPNSEIL